MVLRPYFDVRFIVDLDDVFVFSRNLSQHEKQIREVVKAFLKAGLYAKLSKCLFSVSRILFLGFILTDKGVEIEKDLISTILNRPGPESDRKIESFLGLPTSTSDLSKSFLE